MATRFISKRLLLGIDLFVISISFFLAYLIRFNLSMSFDVSKMAQQLPLVVLIALMALLITGSYKGKFRHTGIRDVYHIFKAICLGSLVIILVNVIIRKLEFSTGFSIPLSIIILYTLLSWVGLTASRYLYLVFHSTLINKDIE